MFKFYKPSKVLTAFVKQYWTLDLDNSSYLPEEQTIIPNGLIELFFNYGELFEYDLPKEQTPLKSRLLICGQNSFHYRIKPTGKVGLLSVMLKPEGAMMFFNMPLSELRNLTIPIDSIYSKETEILEDKILNSSNDKQRIEIVESYLISKIIEDKLFHHKRMTTCIENLKVKQSQVSVRELAECCCLSTKQFQRSFNEHIGIMPKDYLRVIRFQNVIHTKYLKPKLSITELAMECGFYDQSHLIRDFNQFSGYSPKKFFSISETYSDFFS